MCTCFGEQAEALWRREVGGLPTNEWMLLGAEADACSSDDWLQGVVAFPTDEVMDFTRLGKEEKAAMKAVLPTETEWIVNLGDGSAEGHTALLGMMRGLSQRRFPPKYTALKPAALPLPLPLPPPAPPPPCPHFMGQHSWAAAAQPL